MDRDSKNDIVDVLDACLDELYELRKQKAAWLVREEQLVRMADKETEKANAAKQQLAECQAKLRQAEAEVTTLREMLGCEEDELLTEKVGQSETLASNYEDIRDVIITELGSGGEEDDVETLKTLVTQAASRLRDSQQTEAEAAAMRDILCQLEWSKDAIIHGLKTCPICMYDVDIIVQHKHREGCKLAKALSGTAGAKTLAVVKAAVNYDAFLQSKLPDEASPWQELEDAIKAYKEPTP